MLKAIVNNLDLTDREWMRQLFVENRTVFLKWFSSQNNGKNDEVREVFKKKDERLDKLVRSSYEGDLNEYL